MNYKSIIDRYVSLAKEGTKRSIKQLMDRLNKNMSLAESKLLIMIWAM